MMRNIYEIKVEYAMFRMFYCNLKYKGEKCLWIFLDIKSPNILQ